MNQQALINYYLTAQSQTHVQVRAAKRRSRAKSSRTMGTKPAMDGVQADSGQGAVSSSGTEPGPLEAQTAVDHQPADSSLSADCLADLF